MSQKQKTKTIKSSGIIVPAPGMALRCRNGHINSWDVRVIATPDGQRAAVVSVRCSVCGHTLKLEGNRMLEGSGKRTDKKTGSTILTTPGSEHDGSRER